MGRLVLHSFSDGGSRITFHALAVFCANSVPPSVASIQKGIVKSARSAAPHLSDIPEDLLKCSARNFAAVILIVEDPPGFPEYQNGGRPSHVRNLTYGDYPRGPIQ
jgi:hypothetical protein